MRTDNSALGVAGPDRGTVKAKQYLYPSEFQRFVTCEDVPLEWRRAVTLAIYLFPRAGELRVLRWEDVASIEPSSTPRAERERRSASTTCGQRA